MESTPAVVGGVTFGPNTTTAAAPSQPSPKARPMSKDKEISPSAAAVDALIAAYSDGEDEYTYDVPKFGTVRARRLNDATEMVRINEEIEKYSRILTTGPCPPDLAEFKGTDYHILTLCVYGSRLLLSPKLGMKDLLRLARNAGKGLFALTNPLVAAASAEDALATNASLESEGNA